MSIPRAKFKNLKRGFTLIELLVVITIFVILTGVVLFSQSKFNSTILLTNLAYDTALTIRQAQTYGINVKEFGVNNFEPYGVHFETGEKSFILFTELDEDGFFDGLTTETCVASEGCVNRYNIKRGNFISDLCIDNDCGKQELDIVFKRPSPDANIRVNGGVQVLDKTATIKLRNANDDSSTREVVVQPNGLIYIKSH